MRKALVLAALAAILLVQPASAGRICPTYYTLRRGDTLSLVARRFGVTAYELSIANPGVPFQAGWTVTVPCPRKAIVVPRVMLDANGRPVYIPQPTATPDPHR